MSPVVTKILANLKKISDQYQGMDEAHKIHSYILECRKKLLAKKREDLVVELNQALHQRLEYAKRKAEETNLRVKSYLRGPVKSDNSSDDSVGRKRGNTSSRPPATERRLPFREDLD